MAGFGWNNPFPFEFGGGATLVDSTYRALRASVGLGGSADDDENTIDGVWRQARASGLAAAFATGERAVVNYFPGRATDLLPYYEEFLLIVPDDEDDEPGRRREAERRFTYEVDASTPSVEADLERIDERFSILQIDKAQVVETIFGRAFEDFAATLPFGGGRKSSAFANFSTDFILFVLLDIGSGVLPGPAEAAILREAADLLNGALPTWVHFQQSTADGFILDESLLDVTGL
jgi:hypothetical protein